MEKIKLKNGGYFKCPICGCEEFIPGSIQDWTDFGSRTICSSYTCFECGYMILRDNDYASLKNKFDDEFIPLVKELDDAIKSTSNERNKINSEMQDYENKIHALQAELHDENRTVKRDEEIKKEMAHLDELIRLKKNDISDLGVEISEIKQKIEHLISHSCPAGAKDYYQEEYNKHLAKLK